MAKVERNIVIQGLSGSLGDQLVIQGGKGGQTIIRFKPRPSAREPMPAQQKARERFQEATAYGKTARDDPVYAGKAEGTPQTTYNPSTTNHRFALRAGSGGPAQVVPSIALRTGVTARDGSTGSPQACRATRAAWAEKEVA
jgi:hypothetical protein